MRRKKKLILNIIKILAVVLIAVGLIMFFWPNKKVNTSNETQNGKELSKVDPFNAPITKISLPEVIRDSSTNKIISEDEKTYEQADPMAETYIIPMRTDDTINIIIGYDSADLLSSTNSPVQVEKEYPVTGIEENIEATYDFVIDKYDYPIFLLLGESGKLYFVDIEKAYATGIFAINGYIENIPEVKKVYEDIEATQDERTYRTAIICCTNDEGYEFNIDMIGR